MLEAATGVKAFSVGKPSPVMLRAARKELGLTTDQTIVIGDTMETDILGGVQLGFKTILVLSGGTRARRPGPLRLPARQGRRVDRRPESRGVAARVRFLEWQVQRAGAGGNVNAGEPGASATGIR